MFWIAAAIFIGGIALSFAMKPQQSAQKPAGLSEIQVPIASEDADIPVLFGTRDFMGPNCVWYGHLKTKAIKSSGGKK